MSARTQFSGEVTVFHDLPLPEPATPAGYSALIEAYGLQVPLPRLLTATGQRHKTVERNGWRLLSPRHAPAASLEGHLTFALKYEGLDLAVLKRLFLATGPGPLEEIVRSKPTGSYARRLWFLFEWLTEARLNIPDAQTGTYAPVADTDLQWAVKGTSSTRHRVHNNLPGTKDFCPMVFRTSKLDRFRDMDLAAEAQSVVAAVPRDLLARTAAFLLLKDSKASYAIEGEHPPQDRIQRWGRAIGEAGKRPISLDELLRLQRIVIGDARFIKLGLRKEGGFVGEHERDTRLPLPDHVSARPEDLHRLVSGLVAFDRTIAPQLDAVVAAAMLAFGFVYIHPFEDGNGRIHRYLIHHVLAQRDFNPGGVVFPVSAAILDRIADYKAVLETYSARLLPLVEWRSTPSSNVEVLNDTGDFYRYFDATAHAEFLYECVQRTITEDLPRETDFLKRYDSFRATIRNMVEMPDTLVDLLFRFLQQNDGRLSKRSRASEFNALTDAEAAFAEQTYRELFGIAANESAFRDSD